MFPQNLNKGENVKKTRMSRIDYSKWDTLNYSSSSSEEKVKQLKQLYPSSSEEKVKQLYLLCLLLLVLLFLWKRFVSSKFLQRRTLKKTRMSRIDYSKWDTLNYSSSSSEEEDEQEKTQKERVTTAHLENLSISASSSLSSPLWNGLVLHHKDVFVSHVLSKLNRTDRWFFSEVNRESRDVLAYAGVDLSKIGMSVNECTSISTLQFTWNSMPWGEKDDIGCVIDQAWFCWQVAFTNKLEFLKWAREVLQCQWDEKTINVAARKGNLEMLKYCFSNDCPRDEEKACKHAAAGGNLDCLRFLFDKVEPSRETEKEAVIPATCAGHVEILKYFVEETKISEEVKSGCVYSAARCGQLDCLKYLVEEAKGPLDTWEYIACARYFEHPECENYLLIKGCPEPTDEEYAAFVEERRAAEENSYDATD